MVLERGECTSYASCGIPYWLAGDADAFEDLQAANRAKRAG